MATTSVTTDQDAVISEIEIHAPPDRVFKALIDANALERWFTNPSCPVHTWEMDPRIGGRYRYTTKKGTNSVNGVAEFECHGEILELDPPRVLVYTWIGNWHDDKTRSTTVRWELSPLSAGTRVKVTHSGLATLPVARKDYSGGWTGVLDMLKQFAEKQN
jgi:uncharacterized protein YndB with AHSA1/START domain